MSHSCIANTVLNSKQAHPEWLTAKEAARHLRVHPVTLARWAREGKVPAHPLSGFARRCWRFRLSELDAMLAASSAGPTDGRQHEGSTAR